MGKYINVNSKGAGLPSLNKAIALVNDGAVILHYGTTVPESLKFQENLVCVVENGLFDAAGYCYSESEFNQWKIADGRYKTWLYYKYAESLAS